MESLDALIEKAEAAALKNAKKKTTGHHQPGGPSMVPREPMAKDPGEPDLAANPLVKTAKGGGTYAQRHRTRMEADERRRRFARAYFMSGFDQEKGWRAAGWKWPASTGAINRMLKEPVVIDELNKLTAIAREAMDAEVVDVTKLWIEVATSNLLDFMVQDDEGNLSLCGGIKDLPLEKQRQIKKVKIRKRTLTDKDANTEVVVDTEVELWDKTRALDALSKIRGLYKDSMADAIKDFAGVLATRLNRMERQTGRTFTQDGEPVDG